jgi:hypothetical protein
MKNVYPYIYFWLTALSIILISEVSIKNISDVIDINIHDTYYIISRRDIGFVFSFLYILAGFIYWLFQRIHIKLNVNLIGFHTFVSIATVIVYYVFLIYYTYFKTENLFESSNESFINLILVFTTLLIQFHFVYNIIHSVIKHKKTQK